MQIETKDAAVKARTAIIDYASIFTSVPTEANHQPWMDMTHASTDYRAGLFWMLTRVYHHLLRDRPMRNVLPVPESSMDAQMRDCSGSADEAWDKFITCVAPARGPCEATPAQEIEEVVGRRVCDRAGAQLFLQGKGWERG